MTWSLKEASRNCFLLQLTSMLNSKQICNVLKLPLLKVKLNSLSQPHIKKTAYAVFFIFHLFPLPLGEGRDEGDYRILPSPPLIKEGVFLFSIRHQICTHTNRIK